MNLKEFRTKHSISQQTVADSIGVDVTTVCKYETGDVKPSLSTMYLIQKYTNGEVLIEDFVDDKSRKTPKKTVGNRNNQSSLDAIPSQGVLAL